jgi:hypothetical protein
MAVVMLSESCNCGCSNSTFSTLVNKMAVGGPAGCMMSEDAPFLSGLGSWIRENICPACHRAVDNIGDFFVNLTGGVEDTTSTVFGAAQQIVGQVGTSTQQILQGVGTGVGGFIANPQNIPCAIGVVGTAFGAPMGLGGCTPQGFNEQNQTLIPPPSLLSNPLVLGGIGLIAVLLLTKKK